MVRRLARPHLDVDHRVQDFGGNAAQTSSRKVLGLDLVIVRQQDDGPLVEGQRVGQHSLSYWYK